MIQKQKLHYKTIKIYNVKCLRHFNNYIIILYIIMLQLTIYCLSRNVLTLDICIQKFNTSLNNNIFLKKTV